jgi:hypothetical protein
MKRFTRVYGKFSPLKLQTFAIKEISSYEQLRFRAQSWLSDHHDQY